MSSFYCLEKTFCFSSNSFFLLTALIIDSVSHSNFFSFILVTDCCHLKLFSVFSFFVNSLADYALFMPVSNLELILHIAEFIRSVSLYLIVCCYWAERFTFKWNELQCLLDCYWSLTVFVSMRLFISSQLLLYVFTLSFCRCFYCAMRFWAISAMNCLLSITFCLSSLKLKSFVSCLFYSLSRSFFCFSWYFAICLFAFWNITA